MKMRKNRLLTSIFLVGIQLGVLGRNGKEEGNSLEKDERGQQSIMMMQQLKRKHANDKCELGTYRVVKNVLLCCEVIVTRVRGSKGVVYLQEGGNNSREAVAFKGCKIEK